MPAVLSACTDIKGDPLSWLGPGPQFDKKAARPDTPAPPDAVPAIPAKTMTAPNGEMYATMGLNLEELLAGDIKDPQERIARLENTVIAMHKDMEIMASSLDDMDKTAIPPPAPVQRVATAPPEPLTGYDKASTPAPAPPAVQAPEPDIEPIASSAAPSGGSQHVRVGEHPGSVRIVLDVAKGTSFSADLDNSENLLIVDLPGTRWTGPASETFSRMPLLRSYKVSAEGAGSILVVTLSGPTSIIAQSKYPSLDKSGERIVIDLKK